LNSFSPQHLLTKMQKVDFETFSKILNRPGGFREPFDIEEYIRGFQVFDKDRSGFVGKGQIKYILTNLGEKMSEEEVDELFKSTIDASNNEVDYRGKSSLFSG
jgi:Ca2+-binding EF-hand superfamily protein